jgi:hypothetical protein
MLLGEAIEADDEYTGSHSRDVVDELGPMPPSGGRRSSRRSCTTWEGEGPGRDHPDALAGKDIPLSARIVCACDAWSAMTTDRTYRNALSLDIAAAELRACSGTHFDPQVVDALVTVLEL